MEEFPTSAVEVDNFAGPSMGFVEHNKDADSMTDCTVEDTVASSVLEMPDRLAGLEMSDRLTGPGVLEMSDRLAGLGMSDRLAELEVLEMPDRPAGLGMSDRLAELEMFEMLVEIEPDDLELLGKRAGLGVLDKPAVSGLSVGFEFVDQEPVLE